jgi:SAM-dependent methyltransferase
MSALMLNRYPNAKGIAIDLHERPSRLKNKSIEWIQLDLNEDGFAMKADRKADVVYATAVWEHVQYPASFVRNLIHFLNPGGTLYLVCPNYGSIARFVLRTSWPFFTPGEHLNMPTLKGARCCLSSQVRAVKGHQQIFKVWVRPILLPYTVHYVLARFGMQRLAKFFRFLGSVPLPAGALEAALSISEIPDGKIGES